MCVIMDRVNLYICAEVLHSVYASYSVFARTFVRLFIYLFIYLYACVCVYLLVAHYHKLPYVVYCLRKYTAYTTLHHTDTLRPVSSVSNVSIVNAIIIS